MTRTLIESGRRRLQQRLEIDLRRRAWATLTRCATGTTGSALALRTTCRTAGTARGTAGLHTLALTGEPALHALSLTGESTLDTLTLARELAGLSRGLTGTARGTRDQGGVEVGASTTCRSARPTPLRVDGRHEAGNVVRLRDHPSSEGQGRPATASGLRSTRDLRCSELLRHLIG